MFHTPSYPESSASTTMTISAIVKVPTTFALIARAKLGALLLAALPLALTPVSVVYH